MLGDNGPYCGERATPTPFDLSKLSAAFVGEFPRGSGRDLLERSWVELESYRQGLFVHSRETHLGRTSRPDGTIDAYHDLIEVHLGSGRIAYCESDDGHHLRTHTYERLHGSATALAELWRAQGAMAGQRAIVLSVPGSSRVVAVLAGLYLGLEVGVVEPGGRTYVRNRLGWLAPDYIVAGGDSLAWYAAKYDDGDLTKGISNLESAPTLPLSCENTERGSSLETAHRYVPEDGMLAFASPLAEGKAGVCSLSALNCMSAMLTDTQLVLAIRAGERVAAVGRARGLVEPTLWLATLLAGGTFVDLDVEACRRNPELLARARVQVMLPGADLLDTLLSHPTDLTSSWRRWSLDPSGKLAWQRWWTLAERLKGRRVPGFNSIYVAALGGSLAVSPKSLVPDPMRVVPAPGLPWSLHDVTGVGVAVPVDSGLLAVEGFATSQVGELMVAGMGDAYGLAGSLRPRVDGRPYPEQEVVALAELHPAVRFAAVVVIPDRAVMNHGSARLLLFVDPLWAGAQQAGLAVLSRSIQEAVESELGQGAHPERVEAFTLSPRLLNERVDPVWVNGQYVSGMLYKKQPMGAFAALAKIRRLVANEGVAAHEEIRAPTTV